MVYHEKIMFKDNKVTYTRYGEWTDICCLFFHGFFASSDFLPPDADSDGVCVLSFDRPGVGDSDLWGKYKMEDFFEVILRVMAEHNVRGVHVAGHSAGGYYSQVFAMLYPDITRSVTLLSSLPPLNCDETEPLMTKALRKRRFYTNKLRPVARLYFFITADVLNRKCGRVINDRIEQMAPFEQEVYKKYRDVYKNAILMSATKKGKGAFYDAIALFERRAHPVIRSDIPVYIWNGGADQTTTVRFAEFLKKKYNTSRIHIIPEGTHMMFFAVWHEALREAMEERRLL